MSRKRSVALPGFVLGLVLVCSTCTTAGRPADTGSTPQQNNSSSPAQQTVAEAAAAALPEAPKVVPIVAEAQIATVSPESRLPRFTIGNLVIRFDPLSSDAPFACNARWVEVAPGDAGFAAGTIVRVVFRVPGQGIQYVSGNFSVDPTASVHLSWRAEGVLAPADCEIWFEASAKLPVVGAKFRLQEPNLPPLDARLHANGSVLDASLPIIGNSLELDFARPRSVTLSSPPTAQQAAPLEPHAIDAIVDARVELAHPTFSAEERQTMVFDGSSSAVRLEARFPSGIRQNIAESFTLSWSKNPTLQAIEPLENWSTLSRDFDIRWTPCLGAASASIVWTDEVTGNSVAADVDPSTGFYHVNLDSNAGFRNLGEGGTYSWKLTIAGQPVLDSEVHGVKIGVALDSELLSTPLKAPVRFDMGGENSKFDSRPVHSLDVSPFYIESRVINNETAAELFNHIIDRRLASLVSGRLLDAKGNVLVGLDKLSYGVQWGLEIVNGRVSAVKKREKQACTGISWLGAKALSAEASRLRGFDRLPGADYRLPREAEWEFAATLGGKAPSPWLDFPTAKTVNFLRSGDAFEDALAPFTRKGGPIVTEGYYDAARAAALAAKSSQFPGLAGVDLNRLDILGNVWEWCEDWYDPLWYANPDALKPDCAGPASVPRDGAPDELGRLPGRVVRGGAWNLTLAEIDARARGSYDPGATSWSIGVRLVRTAPRP